MKSISSKRAHLLVRFWFYFKLLCLAFVRLILIKTLMFFILKYFISELDAAHKTLAK